MSEADTDAAHAERIKQAAQALNAAISCAAADGLDVMVETHEAHAVGRPTVQIVSVRVLKAL